MIGDPALYDRGTDRLGNIVNSPQRESAKFIVDLTLYCEKYNGNIARQWILFESLTDCVAVNIRHQYIEQNQVRDKIFLCRTLERRFTVFCDDDLVGLI